MNIAPPDITASAASDKAIESATLRGLVLGALLAGACGLGLAAGVGERDVRADQRDQRDPREQRERPQPQPQQQPLAPVAPARDMPQQRGDGRSFDLHADEARRQQLQQQLQQQVQQQNQQNQQQDAGRRGGRLTPDERRELRRQINEAGMDLYPNAPRR